MEATHPKKAVVYCRTAIVSDQIGRQEALCCQYCREQGLEVVQVISDRRGSGMNVNRRGSQSLVADWIENPDSPEFTHIVMRDPTRIARSMKLVIEFDELVKQHGIEVLYVR